MTGAQREHIGGRPCFGVSCRLTRTTDIAPMLRDAGDDRMLLDRVQGPLGCDRSTQRVLRGGSARHRYPLIALSWAA